MREHIVRAGLYSSFNICKADVYPAGSYKANPSARVPERKGRGAKNAIAILEHKNFLDSDAIVRKFFQSGLTHPLVLAARECHEKHSTITAACGFLSMKTVLKRIIYMYSEPVCRDAPAASVAFKALASV